MLSLHLCQPPGGDAIGVFTNKRNQSQSGSTGSVQLFACYERPVRMDSCCRTEINASSDIFAGSKCFAGITQTMKYHISRSSSIFWTKMARARLCYTYILIQFFVHYGLRGCFWPLGDGSSPSRRPLHLNMGYYVWLAVLFSATTSSVFPELKHFML